MSERKSTLEVVHSGGQYDGTGWPPEDPAGFMAWFQERIDLIPVEHRRDAKIELSTEDEHRTYIEIIYSRPETDEEFALRLQQEARDAELRVHNAEQQERQLLAALQAKYGTSPAG